MTRSALVLFIAWLLPALGDASLLSDVSHAPARLSSPGKDEVRIRFRLSEPATVSAHLYDARERLVRTLGGGLLERGEHTLVWDGRDARERPVPPEAYTYTIEVSPSRGATVVWDASDAVDDRAFRPDPVHWDREDGRIRYVLDRASRVRIRIGLENDGPLLATLIDFVPRGPGAQQEPWDGRDASGLLDLEGHPHLAIVVEAFELPPNSIFVGDPPREVRFLGGLEDAPRRPAKPRRRVRAVDPAGQPAELRRDFPIDLTLPADLERSETGLPVVARRVPVRVSVRDADLARILNERCEVVFYLDGRLVFEGEAGFLPMTWHWDPRSANPGEHYITANVRGYEGHFGMNTVKVMVAAEGSGS